MIALSLVLLFVSAPAFGGQPAPQNPGAAAAAPQTAGGAKLGKIVFQRYVDRTEGAFLVLVPKGWSTTGGMVRVNPMTAAGGAGQSIEAKIDFTMMREPAGQVAIRWLPKINYVVPSQYNAMLNGNWNGMPILPMQTPQNYLTQLLFPRLRPQARNMKVLETTSRPDVAAAIRALPAAQAVISQGARYQVDAASVIVTYEEAGTRFKEILFTAIEGFSMMETGLWGNPFTMVARAPEAEYEAYGPVAIAVINSFTLNPRWMAAEMQGQVQRSGIVQQTLADIARIDQEIYENRAKTMAQINDVQYLTLTGQERYVNPHTGREELGSNAWKYRWENPSGEVIYTDDGNWDPNIDPDLHVSGYKRSAVKPRN